MEQKKLHSIELKMENGIAVVFKINGKDMKNVLKMQLYIEADGTDWALRVARDELYTSARPVYIKE